MIKRAEKASLNKVKNMAECVASENSWRLSQNFEKDCKERANNNNNHSDEDLYFSSEVQSFADSCKVCYLSDS